ncbi:uncharacterized protein ALTATR162_LOCUS11204 [Alternaria atra]|uniref:Uncharacterized protein n=1 Tax=Alternaria atra TaxID=119953 RepID=A0A8J2INK9_9PLEO|nr:uncharacterized protein ALTATR162_LOCUS11204 [Alternaria atra]CAG5185036.1 unnamed protein product [Alternaria atra]
MSAMNIPATTMPGNRRSSGETLSDKTKIKSKPCATQDSSRLLKLPAELRDMTYGFVMHRPDGIKFLIQNKRNTEDVEKNPVEARPVQNMVIQGVALNPLKLVCRQLYIETLGLLLESSNVHFRCRLGTNLESRRRTLSRFIDQCKTYRFAALNQVTIDVSNCKLFTDPFPPIEFVKSLQRINSKICAETPRITVHVRDHWWDQCEVVRYEWIQWAFVLQEGLRNKSTIAVPDAVREDSWVLGVQLYIKRAFKHTSISENCRLMFSSYFPEDNVHREAQDWYGGHFNEKTATIIEQARKALEDGI